MYILKKIPKLYQMHQPSQQPTPPTPPPTHPHTSSLLHLQIPPQIQNQPYAIQWLSQPNPQFNNNYILTRFDVNRIGRSCQFQCTPLDYGSVVLGRVLVGKEKGFEVLGETRFGPVAVDRQIVQQSSTEQPADVKIILNKTITLSGTIKLSTPKNSSSTSLKTTITLEAPHFKFDIKIDQNIRLPSNNSFFKFYQREDDMLGISIYHQHSELVEIMKDDKGDREKGDREKGEKNSQLFGFYVKIGFKGRAARDSFLFNLMMRLGIKIQELQPDTSEKYSVNIKQSKQLSIQKQLQTPQPPKKKQSKIKQLDDQILKLLSDPSEADNELSLDMAQAQLLLSSSKNIQINKNAMKESDLERHQIKTPFLKEKNQNMPALGSRDQEIMYHWNGNFQEDLSMKTRSNHSKFSHNLLTPEGSQNQLRNTIIKLTNQVKMLRKQNRRLVHQNKKLKDQNMRLRYREIKNNSISRVCEPNKTQKKQKLTEGREKSCSIAVKPFLHQKRQSFYPYNLDNRHLTTKSNLTQININQISNKHKTRVVKQAPLASSAGSILIASSYIKNTDRTDQHQLPYHHHPLNSSSAKDLAKQCQFPQQKQKATPDKLTYHRSQQLLRQVIPIHTPKQKSQSSFYEKQNYIKSSLNMNTLKIPNFGNSSVQFVNSTIFGR